MDDTPIEWTRAGFTVSTDRARLILDDALALLNTTSWGIGLPPEVLRQAIDHSITFGMYQQDRLIGLARVVTDRTSFGYLTDVVVHPDLRNQGLGLWMMECVLQHPDLQSARRISLLTRDAKNLYARCGFTEGPPEDHVYMEIKRGIRR